MTFMAAAVLSVTLPVPPFTHESAGLAGPEETCLMPPELCDGLPAPRPPDIPPEPPGEWVELAAGLPDTGRVLLLGSPDCGKTTFGWWLARQLHRRGPVALVDADVGQSRIGPPASVGWYRPGDGRQGFFFVGSVSPERRPATVLQATGQAHDIAAETARWVVVDTTGYLQGRTAIVLKGAKIKNLRPVHVVAIGDGDEDLEAVLAPWLEDRAVILHRLQSPSGARTRSVPARAQWRQEAFAAWLSGANLRWVELAGKRIVHEPEPEFYEGSNARQLEGLLVGFGDDRDNGLCIGLLRTMDLRGRRMLCLCPEQAAGAARVDFGCLRLEPDGRQISYEER